MPWCPNCKTEYKQGVLVCGDCGSELVEEQPIEISYVPLNVIETQDIADKLIKYLEYSKVDSHYEYSEQELGFVILVQEDDFKKAQKAFRAFYDVEIKLMAETQTTNTKNTTDTNVDVDVNDEPLEEELSEDLANEYEMDELEKEKRKVSKMMFEGGAYEKKREKSKELKSTAIMFVSFGVLGLGFVVLNFLKVIPYLNGPLPYTVMTGMFIGFIVIGINSFDRSKKAAQDAILEEETTSKITQWLNEQITSERLASMQEPTLSEEANFIRMMEIIKMLVTNEFGQLDDAYLDYVTEDFYNNRFDK